ncbi:unnamed protein product [Polarella glacialis]|uniref:Uncharacterized protein n=1 Tax=Polarella glacialis TaxID=89957 RepID=A0A813L9I5_POLGL|nr:unnamed protein product [Polarella glacialis]CAE8722265.1 unnamed protein product [Polarella glacialis]
MGSGASAPLAAATTKEASADDLKAVPSAKSEVDRKKIQTALDSSSLSAPLVQRPITKGLDAKANQPRIVGYGPIAPRPDWLPKTGPGQKNVDPLCWCLSVAQWVFFIRKCVETCTWKKLAEIKGEYEITMYDICEKPWTEGTGCSIALLMNTAEQLPVEGMLSHAWAGSVVETYNCLQSMVNHFDVPLTAHFFLYLLLVSAARRGSGWALDLRPDRARAVCQDYRVEAQVWHVRAPHDRGGGLRSLVGGARGGCGHRRKA